MCTEGYAGPGVSQVNAWQGFTRLQCAWLVTAPPGMDCELCLAAAALYGKLRHRPSTMCAQDCTLTWQFMRQQSHRRPARAAQGHPLLCMHARERAHIG